MHRANTPVEGTEEWSERTDEAPRITDMEITGPTLTWLEVESPQQPIPIGENDRVLDSRFNEEYDVWEVLLVALPDDEEDEEDE